ncbi:MAG: hydrogenase maturation protease [Thermoplasmata archaeon]
MKKVLIIGVGNRILGDDGVGSLLVERISDLVNDNIDVIDAGISLYEHLWSLQFEENLPDMILIMDIMNGTKPGELHFIDYTSLNKNFFSSHLFPDTIFFYNIAKRGVKIKFLLCEIKEYEKIFTEKLSENGKICMEKMEKFIRELLK